jgi:L-asparaginase
MNSRTKILLIYTGGTIGMRKDLKTGALKAFNFSKLLQRVPELKQLDCEIETFSFQNPIDSSNMSPSKWVEIASIIESHYAQFDGFVVLHGSDTMSYTASALSFMFENLTKPVILTGSQLPMGDLRTDAKENLITAVQIASLQENNKAVIQEVCLYFEYKLYRGNRTTKINSENFNAFCSPNYPALAESGVYLNFKKELFLAPTQKDFSVNYSFDTNVVIIKMFPGISETIFNAILALPGLKGIVLETYGSGNAITEDWFIAALSQAIHNGLPVINVSQCSAGSVNMGQYETSSDMKRIGVISGKDITAEAAITKLMFLLSQNIAVKDFKFIFEKSLRGELTE